jgi:hypothetical protein|tara:strand:- start:1213 stop:1986 length:774 start_codon:yes stop_codon:yes gene_type:complete
MDKKVVVIVALLIVLVVLLGVYFLEGFNFKSYIEDIGSGEVNDYLSCVRAGNPIMESYPRRCRHEDVLYVEEISKKDVPLEVIDYFWEEMDERGVENGGGRPIEGFNPQLYKLAFPGLIDEDFDGAEGVNGRWEFDGELKWIGDSADGLITSADGVITQEGMVGVLDNLVERLDVEVSSKSDIDELIDRVSDEEKVYCTPEQREMSGCNRRLDPVCGWSDPAKIQCVKWPCATTYGNSCEACRDEMVLYYTEGECPE